MRSLPLNIFKKLSLPLMMVCFLADPAWGASIGEADKPKQLCENDAKELFKRETGKMILDKMNLSYANHYNQTLKTCFMIIQLSTDLNLLDPPAIENLSYDFYDVNENAKIGSFFTQLDRKSGKQTLFYCHVSKEECHTLPEWKKLIKPFMED